MKYWTSSVQLSNRDSCSCNTIIKMYSVRVNRYLIRLLTCIWIAWGFWWSRELSFWERFDNSENGNKRSSIAYLCYIKFLIPMLVQASAASQRKYAETRPTATNDLPWWGCTSIPILYTYYDVCVGVGGVNINYVNINYTLSVSRCSAVCYLHRHVSAQPNTLSLWLRIKYSQDVVRRNHTPITHTYLISDCYCPSMIKWII